MTVLSPQPLRAEPIAALPVSGAPDRPSPLGALLTGLLGFLCVMPYPAVAIGARTGLQLGLILTGLMLLPMLTMTWNRRPLGVYLAILAPLCLSALVVALTHMTDDLRLSLKTVSVWAICCLALLAAQIYAPRHFLALLTGLALATLLHAAVGVWQAWAFASGQFPLVALYVNPSFLSVQENALTLARYTQRPFGLFPEPSAMASSLAPWVLFWFAHLLGVARWARKPAVWQRALFASAAVAGLGLMILSRSGHATITLAAILAFFAAWLLRCPATWRSYFCIVLAFGVVLPGVIWLAALSLSDRVRIDNGSWEERSSSLLAGFNLMVHGDLKTILFGMGPGLSAPTLERLRGLEAVWSVSLTYLYETGLMGLLAVGAVAAVLLKKWHTVRYDFPFAVIFLVWLVGVTLTTSYEQLLSLWVTLGWLTVWPETSPSTGSGEASSPPLPQAVEYAQNLGRRLR